jgi:hypothetical protein
MTEPNNLELFEVGYREDGVFWITDSDDVRDAAAAERYMGESWRVVEAVHVGPTGRRLNSKDAEWTECAPDAPGARRGWRLIDTEAPEILFEGEWQPNPLRP